MSFTEGLCTGGACSSGFARPTVFLISALICVLTPIGFSSRIRFLNRASSFGERFAISRTTDWAIRDPAASAETSPCFCSDSGIPPRPSWLETTAPSVRFRSRKRYSPTRKTHQFAGPAQRASAPFRGNPLSVRAYYAFDPESKKIIVSYCNGEHLPNATTKRRF